MTTPSPLLAWYGDDFTGSAAVMEVLAFAGIPSVLFTDIPDAALAARFAHCRALGIASTARSHGPEWMGANLPAPLSWLHATGADLLHYKLCSTFDSSPTLGSIGRALEIALTIRPSRAIPLLTAAPQMRRWQSFGHLFAGCPDGIFRLDRHPVMSRHPATPMDDSDLLRHLARQTTLPSALIDLDALATAPQSRWDEATAQGARILSLDSIDAATEAAAGRLIWENRKESGLVAGSQGVEYALVRHWRQIGLIPPPPPAPSAGPVARIVAVSGSVSPVTAAQIAWAGANGFALLPFDAATACADDAALGAEEARLTAAATEAAARGQSPLIHSAAGHDDPAVARFRAALSTAQTPPETANRRVGEALGRILSATLRATGIPRAVISGGDTSGHALRQLDLHALTALAPTIPGAALCTAHGAAPHDGLQIALKGGQMGSQDYFGWIRAGGGPRQ